MGFVLAAGRLDRKIAIERFGAVEDEHGDRVESWAPLANVSAEVVPAPGGERYSSSENAATALTRFTIRWSTTVADVNPKDRIGYGGRFYNIKSAIELGRRVGIEILAAVETD